jgi:MFS family permease
MFLMIFVGLTMVLQMATSNTILQSVVDNDKRGRVMSFYTMAFMGMAPFGSLLAGSLAKYVGSQNTLTFSGIVCIIAALVFSRQRHKLKELIDTVKEPHTSTN